MSATPAAGEGASDFDAAAPPPPPPASGAPLQTAVPGSGVSLIELNVDAWLFAREELFESSPTLRSPGWSLERQEARRYAALDMIVRAGIKVFKHRRPAWTAAIYFNRFFGVKSMAEFEPNAIACAALLLAGKHESHPIELNQMAACLYALQQGSDPVTALPMSERSEAFVRMREDVAFARAREEVALAEMNMLDAFAFSLETEHDVPWELLREEVKNYSTPEDVQAGVVELLRDFALTPLTVQYKAQVLLSAAMYVVASRGATPAHRDVLTRAAAHAPYHVVDAIMRELEYLRTMLSS